MQILVLLIGDPNPLVKAEADNSSPIFVTDISKGTNLYSIISIGLFLIVTPFIFMAFCIEIYSSFTVGKNLNTTENGIMILYDTLSFSIAAINSLTEVVLIK